MAEANGTHPRSGRVKPTEVGANPFRPSAPLVGPPTPGLSLLPLISMSPRLLRCPSLLLRLRLLRRWGSGARPSRGGDLREHIVQGLLLLLCRLAQLSKSPLLDTDRHREVADDLFRLG